MALALQLVAGSLRAVAAPNSVGAPLDPPTRQADARLTAGDIDGAVTLLTDAAAANLADVELVRRALTLALQTGRYAAASKLADRAARRGPVPPALAPVLAQVWLAFGQATRAERLLEGVVRKAPEAVEARVALGALYRQTGSEHLAAALLDPLPDSYAEGHVTEPRDVLALGKAFALLGLFRDANAVYSTLQDQDPDGAALNLAWGQLLLDKYNYRDADLSFQRALEAEPRLFAAELGRARVDLESDHDRTRAGKRVQAVLAQAPDLIEALELQAELFMDAESLDEAEAVLQRVLKQNPARLESLALLAAICDLRDDVPGTAAAVRRTLAANPRYARLFDTLARFAEQAHRYTEAIAWSRRALELDGEYAPALVRLGIGYSRLGDDENARLFLERGHTADPYSVRAFNMAKVLYGRVFDAFEFAASEHVRYRFHRKERAVLEALVPTLVEEAYRAYSQRYAFEPRPPLQVEVFPKVEDFSIRSVGTRHLGAHAICFGHVVTARSPNAGNFNWAEVLWHELAHVFHLQLSRSRVPRWFTEGLAVLEERHARPEWIRRMEADLAAALVSGQLAKVGRFNLAFTHARSARDILLAYYQAYQVLAFIEARWGMSHIVEMLKGYGQGKTTEDLLGAVLGVTPDAFDQAFAAHLRAILAVYLENVDLALRAVPALTPAGRPLPAATRAALERARAALQRRQPAAARTALEPVLAREPDEPLAHFLVGESLFREENGAAARPHFDAVLAAGRDGFQLRMRLALLALSDGDDVGALAQLEAAALRDPLDPTPHALQADILERLNRDDAQYAALRRAADLDQNNVRLVRRGLALAERLGKRADIVSWLRRGLEIAPFASDLHLAMGRQLAGAGDCVAALRSFALAADTEPDHPVAVLVEQARCLQQTGRLDEAREQLRRALDLDPQDAPARDLSRALGL